VTTSQPTSNPWSKIVPCWRYTSLLRTEVIKDIFEQRRNYPKILKLMAYGRQDAIFERYLLNGTSYYYTYGQGSLTEDYNKKMCEKYKGLTKFNTTNIQERFVYSFRRLATEFTSAASSHCRISSTSTSVWC
jgi:hypothetical protein